MSIASVIVLLFLAWFILPAERLSTDPADLAEIEAYSEASLACSKRVQPALQVVAIRSNNLRMIEIFVG